MYELRHYWPGQRGDEGELITGWESIVYWQCLNDVQVLEQLRLPVTNAWAGKMREWSRLMLTRHENVVWYGYLVGEEWAEPSRGSDAYVTFFGKDLTEEAALTRVIPPAYKDQTISGVPGLDVWGYRFDYFEPPADHADDLCKLLVNWHMINPEESRRRRVLLSCDPDYHKGPITTRRYCGESLLEALQEIGAATGVWWRFVASATGARFETRYPSWGTDRTQGTANECVFDTRLGTIQGIACSRNWADARTVAYARGQVSAGAPKYYMAYDYESIGRLRWRESWAQSESYGNATDMLAMAEAALKANREKTELSFVPSAGTYKTLWDVGDKVTIISRRGNRPYTWNAVITAARIELTPELCERVTEIKVNVC